MQILQYNFTGTEMPGFDSGLPELYKEFQMWRPGKIFMPRFLCLVVKHLTIEVVTRVTSRSLQAIKIQNLCRFYSRILPSRPARLTPCFSAVSRNFAPRNFALHEKF